MCATHVQCECVSISLHAVLLAAALDVIMHLPHQNADACMKGHRHRVLCWQRLLPMHNMPAFEKLLEATQACVPSQCRCIGSV